MTKKPVKTKAFLDIGSDFTLPRAVRSYWIYSKIVCSFFLNILKNRMRMSIFSNYKPIQSFSLFYDFVLKMNQTSGQWLKFDKVKVLIRILVALNLRKVFSLPKAYWDSHSWLEADLQTLLMSWLKLSWLSILIPNSCIDF